MTTPDPQKQPPSTDIFTSLISGFQSLPPILAYGGLLLVATILLAWLTGAIPDILLAVPFAALFAFLFYSFFNTRAEQEKYQRELAHELEKQRLELERLKMEKDYELANKKVDHKHERDMKKPNSAPTQPPLDTQKKNIVEKGQDDYLRYLLKQCEFVSLDTLDDDSTDQDRSSLALSTVFTSLDVRDNRQPDDPQERMRSKEERREPALARLGRNQYLVLLGEAGSGKSTLVNFVALCMAGEKLGREEANLNHMAGWSGRWVLPVRVVLRDYAAQGQGLLAGQTLWEFIVAQLSETQVQKDGTTLAGYVPQLKETLEKEGGLLLLDGLDEVPEADERREALRSEILRFKADFHKVRILVTSRPYAYAQPEWQLPKPFASEQLLDFSPEQIEQYIDQRYGLLAEGQPELERERIDKSAEELKDQIKRRHDLQELAVRPLLLVLITSLHRWQGGGRLPQDREKLYDQSVDRLLQKWQKGKTNANEGEMRPLMSLLEANLDQLRRALSKVAFTVHATQAEQDKTADIPVTLLAGELHVVSNKKVATPEIIRYLKDRAGLLQERSGIKGKEVYAFVHRTFQEYLAARYILEQDEWEPAPKFAKLAIGDSTRWREALLLASKRADWTIVWAIIDHLWPAGEPPEMGEIVVLDNAQQWGIFLASEIWRERELWQNLAERRQPWLAKQQSWSVALLNQEQGEISPADRAVLGMVLGQLGDPREGVDVKNGLPDVVWGGVVKASKYTIGDKRDNDNPVREIAIGQDYQLAKYPITNAQFQCFVEAMKTGNLGNAKWWEGMPEEQKDVFGDMRIVKQIDEPRWNYPNHPRETVSWYQAVAFARWLSDKLGYEVRLPHEHEWEVAAKYQHGRTYPWGEDEFDPAKANTAEGGLGQTTAVGLYPTGHQPILDLYDMSGNVWEWCQNQYQDPAQDEVDDSGNARVLRGGSWDLGQDLARAAYRYGGHPGARRNDVGFRVVRCVSSSISS